MHLQSSVEFVASILKDPTDISWIFRFFVVFSLLFVKADGKMSDLNLEYNLLYNHKFIWLHFNLRL